MLDSHFSSLSGVLPSGAIKNMVDRFGVSEQSVLRSMQSSIAAIVHGFSAKSGDSGFVHQLTDAASSTPDNAVSTALSQDALTNPAAPSLSASNHLLRNTFGDRLGALTQALSGHGGLQAAGASTVLSLGGLTALSLLGKKLRDGSVTASTLPAFLQKESAALQEHVPVGFGAATATYTHRKVEVDPVIAQSVQAEKRHSAWPWVLLAILGAILLGLWGYSRRAAHQPVTAVVAPPPVHPLSAPPLPAATPPGPPAAPTATVVSTNGTDLGHLVVTKLCDGSTLRTPERGVEGKLVAFIENPSTHPDKTSWQECDRLRFNTDSATLQSQSADQLNDVAAILKACPAVHLTVGGYTDSTGDATHNQQLSQERADSVVAEIETRGVPADRLVATGYGDTHPVADNDTPEGRASNRRIAILVTQK